MVNILVENFDFEAQFVAAQDEVRRRSADVHRLLEEKRDISLTCAHLERYKAALQHEDFPRWLWSRAENLDFEDDTSARWEKLPMTTRRRWRRIAEAAHLCAAALAHDGCVIYSGGK